MYNEIGKVVERYDAAGRVTRYEYDELGRQVRTIRPDGIESRTEYDEVGRVKWAVSQRVNEQGQTGWLYSRALYDEAGRVWGSETWDGEPDETPFSTGAGDTSGVRLSASYTNMNLASESTGGLDPRGFAVGTTEYDGAGRTAKSIDALGNITVPSYNAANEQTSMTDALGHVSTMQYDEAGRLVSSSSPVSTTSTVFDKMGRRVSETDGSSVNGAARVTQYVYDELGRLSAVIDAGGFRTVYGYDELGRKVSQTDANGNTTRFEYDEMGRMVARVLPLGQRETMRYRRDGRLVEKTDFNGVVTTFAYDDDIRFNVAESKRVGRLMERTSTGGTAKVKRADGKMIDRFVPGVTTRYFYYADGTRSGSTKVVEATAQTPAQVTSIGYVYDIRGRLLKVVNYQGVSPNVTGVLFYTYDDNGNRLSISKMPVNGGTTPVWSVRYGYDILNRLEKVYHNGGSVTTYTYDKVGNRKTVARAKPNGNVTVATTYGYDIGNRLTSVTNSVGSSFVYTLDGAGRRLAVSDSNPAKGVTNYTYDALGRLVREVGLVAGDISYFYDNVGNRTSRVKAGIGAGSGTTGYEYDANDRLTREVSPDATTLYGYDLSGNLRLRSEQKTAGVVTNTLFEFDSEDKMVGSLVSTGDVETAPLVKRTEYVYDPEGNRVGKTVYGENGGGAAVSTAYLVDTTAPYAQVVEDIVGSVTTRYECGHEIALLSRGDSEAFYLYDGLGSVIGLADVATGSLVDGSGYAFDAYGMPIAVAGGDNLDLQPFLGVGGQEFDSELGLYYLRARYYAPGMGRLLTRDPYLGDEAVPNTLHPYRYAANNPTSNVDPSGRAEYSMGGLMASTGIGAVLTAVNGNLMNYAKTGKLLSVGQTLQHAAFGAVAGATVYGLFWGASLIPAVEPFIPLIQSMLGSYGLSEGLNFAIEIFKSDAPLDQKAAAAALLLESAIFHPDISKRIPGMGSISKILEGLGRRTDALSRLFQQCFVAGTVVQTERGARPIESIKSGDKVFSRNSETNRTSIRKVIRVFKRTVHDIVKIEFADSKTGYTVETLQGTPEHPFFVECGVIAMGKLGIGTKVLTRAGPKLIVKSVVHTKYPNGILVYNFEVESDHTYFVGTASNGIWVHNTCFGTVDDIYNAIGDDLFFHYTDESSLTPIMQSKMLLPGMKGRVHMTQRMLSSEQAEQQLFIGATTHAGRGKNLIA